MHELVEVFFDPETRTFCSHTSRRAHPIGAPPAVGVMARDRDPCAATEAA